MLRGVSNALFREVSKNIAAAPVENRMPVHSRGSVSPIRKLRLGSHGRSLSPPSTLLCANTDYRDYRSGRKTPHQFAANLSGLKLGGAEPHPRSGPRQNQLHALEIGVAAHIVFPALVPSREKIASRTPHYNQFQSKPRGEPLAYRQRLRPLDSAQVRMNQEHAGRDGANSSR